MTTPFRGWSNAAIDFYRELTVNNNKTFWLAHKSIYDDEVRAPFEALSDLVTDEFGPLKIFRPNRDVRFGKDKTPYKTNCSAVTEGEGGEAYYVELSGNGLLVASGYWMMAKDQLVRFRESVANETSGAALEWAVAEMRRQKFDVEGHGLKTAPRRYPRDHPRIELLRFKSVAAMKSFEPVGWMHTKAAAKRIADVWRAAAPMNEWMAEHVGPSTEAPDDDW